jgi:hypothetical protein
MLELSKPTESRYIPFMMKQNAFHLAKKMAVMLVFLYIASLAQEAFAQSRVKGQYASSRSPVYQVGDYNGKLSRMCRRGQFKQRKILNLSIGYIGPNGQGITGIAQKGCNLYDPQGVAEDERTYHFFNQGFSNCRVYVAVTPRPRNR